MGNFQGGFSGGEFSSSPEIMLSHQITLKLYCKKEKNSNNFP